MSDWPKPPPMDTLAWLASLSAVAGNRVATEGYILELLAIVTFADRPRTRLQVM